MANTIIHIKRSYQNASPGALKDGELAYSFVSNTLWIGNQSNTPVIITDAAARINSTYAFIQANSAYNSQNTTGVYANAAFAQANLAISNAGGSAQYSNAAFVQANSAYASQNTTGIYANSAYASQNTTGIYANAAFLKANSAYDSQNTTGIYANSAFTFANSAGSYANSAFLKANSAYGSQNTTGVYANAAFEFANSAGSYANSAFLKANSAYGSQNTTGSYANSAYAQANGASIYANGAFVTANAALPKSGGTITGSLTVSQDVTVQGNLSVFGNSTIIYTTSLDLTDSLIYLANGNFSGDAVDIGFVGHYNDTGNAHTGLIRDPNLKEYIFFKGYLPEVQSNNLINIAHPSFSYANVYADNFKGNVIANNVYVKGFDILTLANNALPNTGSPITVNGNSQLILANTAAATSNSTGALVVKGGIASNGAFYTTGGSITINNGLTTTGNTGTINLGDGAFTKTYGSPWVFNGGLSVVGQIWSTTASLQGVGGSNSAPTFSLYGTQGFGTYFPGGQGAVAIAANTANVLFLTAPPGGINYLQVTGSNTGNVVQITTQGGDANVSLLLAPKGTGALDIQTANGVNISNGGTVTALTRTSGGGSYTSVPTLTISPPTTAGGIQATGSFLMEQSSVTIVSGGTGYSLNDVLVAVGGTFSTVAQFTVTGVTGGVITSVNGFTAYGRYSVLPTNPVSVTGGTGTGATFSINSWAVSPVSTISNAGSGYVEQPTITFSGGGGGSGAAAYATVGSSTTVRGIGSNIIFNTPGGPAFRISDNGITTNGYFAAYGLSSAGQLFSVGAGTGFVGTSSTGSLDLGTNFGTTQARVAHTSSAVNYVQVTGGVTGGQPTISVQGSDASIALNYRTKGTWNHAFQNGSGQTGLIVEPIGTANYLQVTSANPSNAPILKALGSDTNIDLSLTAKGSGNVTTSSAFVSSNTVSSIANNTGAVIVTGGIGVTGNVYVGYNSVMGFANSSSISSVYTYYNQGSNSMDTVFA